MYGAKKPESRDQVTGDEPGTHATGINYLATWVASPGCFSIHAARRPDLLRKPVIRLQAANKGPDKVSFPALRAGARAMSERQPFSWRRRPRMLSFRDRWFVCNGLLLDAVIHIDVMQVDPARIGKTVLCPGLFGGWWKDMGARRSAAAPSRVSRFEARLNADRRTCDEIAGRVAPELIT
jgi:hypothetical protein